MKSALQQDDDAKRRRRSSSLQPHPSQRLAAVSGCVPVKALEPRERRDAARNARTALRSAPTACPRPPADASDERVSRAPGSAERRGGRGHASQFGERPRRSPTVSLRRRLGRMSVDVVVGSERQNARKRTLAEGRAGDSRDSLRSRNERRTSASGRLAGLRPRCASDLCCPPQELGPGVASAGSLLLDRMSTPSRTCSLACVASASGVSRRVSAMCARPSLTMVSVLAIQPAPLQASTNLRVHRT